MKLWYLDEDHYSFQWYVKSYFKIYIWGAITSNSESATQSSKDFQQSILILEMFLVFNVLLFLVHVMMVKLQFTRLSIQITYFNSLFWSSFIFYMQFAVDYLEVSQIFPNKSQMITRTWEHYLKVWIRWFSGWVHHQHSK